MDIPPGNLQANVKDDNLSFKAIFPDMPDQDLYTKLIDSLQKKGIHDWLKESGLDVPNSTDGWKELAALAGIPHQRILTAEFTRAEVVSTLRAIARRKQWLATHGERRLPESEDKLNHSPGFTSVNTGGKTYTFNSGHQAESIRVLFDAWKQGTPTMTEKQIGESFGSKADHFQLSKVFRTKKANGGYDAHPAWGTLIKRVAKGTYQLKKALRLNAYGEA
jgi:hypothetical protein